ncbi:3-deoxy-7-phosphoheptulonate synthase [Streptomyces sp. NPDC006645]|uniref:3-deoxy-7-phosphoheptulonate synthase n=1 Tax=unclassified Streptomyces TaxID=2593676 RepID=UPI0033B62EBB
MEDALSYISQKPAAQQPSWEGAAELAMAREQLARRPPLVTPGQIRDLRTQLASVADDGARVVQAGDCAEDPAESTRAHVVRKAALLDLLAGTLSLATHRPVIRVGRMAGQYGKPRSSPVEYVDGVELPVFRGHLVNGPEPDPLSRRADPRRLLTAFRAAGSVMGHLGWLPGAPGPRVGAPVWTSHEALVLDYEIPQVRRDVDGRHYLSSTHWPWVGKRTAQPDGAHIDLLSAVANPVSVKIGPDLTADELLTLCRRLDPRREPGRLTLIARMGADLALDRLPPLVTAVRSAGHPAIWLCDPMHGNTVPGPGGRKTRYLSHLTQELTDFQKALASAGGVAGGVHLEATPDDVAECLNDTSRGEVVGHYTSLCDPRLNARQAVEVLAAWRG